MKQGRNQRRKQGKVTQEERGKYARKQGMEYENKRGKKAVMVRPPWRCHLTHTHTYNEFPILRILIFSRTDLNMLHFLVFSPHKIPSRLAWPTLPICSRICSVIVNLFCAPSVRRCFTCVVYFVSSPLISRKCFWLGSEIFTMPGLRNDAELLRDPPLAFCILV